MRNTLIIGATSTIAHATARLFAVDGDRLFLVARNQEKLNAVADDLRVRGASQVETITMDALAYDRHQEIVAMAVQTLGGIDLAFIAHGSLPDQKACESSFDVMRQEFEINALSAISLLTHVANHFEKCDHGTIAVITSVAGDRGRKSNYVYGTAKKTVSSFLEGLRHRLAPHGVNVLDIRPGFVDTNMTTQFKKGVLWASPNAVARGIHSAIRRGKGVVYVPRYWRWIMAVIRSLPNIVFNRLDL